MRELAPDLWVAEGPQRFYGLELGARMTVVRLSGGRLWVHSPIAATEARLAEAKSLGEVTAIVAPNRLHHLHVASWQQAFPAAATYLAPTLDQKRPDLTATGVLGDEPEAPWRDEIDQVVLRGFPFANEVVFFHRASATLIGTDLAFNIDCHSPAPTRWFFRMGGTFGRLAPTLLERMLVKDRTAFRASLDQILAWPFERVVVAHGSVVETGGREQLERGYRWA